MFFDPIQCTLGKMMLLTVSVGSLSCLVRNSSTDCSGTSGACLEMLVKTMLYHAKSLQVQNVFFHGFVFTGNRGVLSGKCVDGMF